MKVAARDVGRFVKAPPPAIKVVVVYGPDEGLVREQGRALVKSQVDDLDDPFAISRLDPPQIKEDPTLLPDEAAAIPMMGGRKVVWVRGAEDGPTAKALTLFLDDPKGDGLVVIEAGDLSPRAALRKLAEASDMAAALPCYEDDARSIEQIIGETLKAEGLSVSPDAMTYLAARLGSDRAVTRTELKKLALYMGVNGAEVAEADAEAVVGDLSALTLDTIIDSAFSGDVRTLDQTILRAFAENTSEIAILRMSITHLEKLASVAAAQAQGQSADQAIKGLRPPLYFKRQNAFRQQVGRWPQGRIATARALLYDAERDCKTTGLPTQAICHRALLRLAVAARRAR